LEDDVMSANGRSASDLAYLGLTEAAVLVAQRKVSPVELTRNILDRISALQPTLRAFAAVQSDRALGNAKDREAEAQRGALRGPLHGVPVAVKDLCDMRGEPTAAGIPMFRDRVADDDSTVVRRLEHWGAIIIGKTELSEGALALHHPDIALPVNPWREDLWTGSSSSGSGVAAAAGLCYAAIGSDTGGSIRFPSLCNALVGVKPTWGRVSRHGVFPLSWTLDHVGPMCRRVEDAAAVLAVIAGRDDDDPTSLAAPVDDYASEMGQSLKGLRLGFDEAYATANVIPETVEVLRKAIGVLLGRGAELHSIRMPPTRDAIACWTPICLSEALCVHSDTAKTRPDGYSESFKEFLGAGAAVSGQDYAKANLARRQFAGNLEALFGEIDLMLVPVMANPVPTVDDFARICPDPEGLERLIYFTCIYDVSGHPTITLPGGLSNRGEPLAFQLVSRYLGESLLLRAGKAWQDEFAWRQRPTLAP
jgi:amidase